MDIDKILKAAHIFQKKAQTAPAERLSDGVKIEQATLEDAIHNAGLGPWQNKPSEPGDPVINYSAPFFTSYVNPALDATGITKVSITANPNGTLAVITEPRGKESAFLGTPTMRDYAAKIAALAVPGSAPANLIQNYG